MFSFHKPKIYRSNLGCCICKAKSSSSRFTDSKKYENEFERCFRIDEKRSGEICNACVLLVKRWKKLSPENRLTKHWHHVVDARAGPGTKLTGNRRLIGHQQHHNNQHSDSPNNNSQSSSNRSNSSKSEQALPLSSSNQANQSTSSSSSANSNSSSQLNQTRARGGGNSLNKARAIDTNVSTFTFGEPPVAPSAYRRQYKTLSNEPTTSSYPRSSSPMLKPQSALNSNAFELVIKRFRQRQQQQHLEAQRRLLNRQERQRLRQLNHDKLDNATTTTKIATTSPTKTTKEVKQESTKSEPATTTRRIAKTSKRSCENNSSSTSGGGANGALDNLKIGQLLDASIWRKEKICCGIIFRGLHNEVAIFPKLLRPCECRLLSVQNSSSSGKRELTGENDERLSSKSLDDEEEEDDDNVLLNRAHHQQLPANSPPPRATKSGSISSCNSSTSGTGSMEPTLDEIKRSNRDKNDPSPAVRPRQVPAKRRLQQLQRQKPAGDVESISSSGASTTSGSSGASKESASSPHSSEHSSPSTRMVLIDDCGDEIVVDTDDDDDHDDVDDELVMAQDDSCESSNDASSSGESLVEMERKKSGAVV